MRKTLLAIIIAAFTIALQFAACELGGPVQLPVYTIEYNANEGSGNMDKSTHVYGTAQNLRANRFTRNGYRFTGWATTANGTREYTDGESVLNLTKESGKVITLYALWEGDTYTVIYNANGGDGTMANSVFTFGVSQALSENVFTRTGFTFDGWSKVSGIQPVEFTDKQEVKDITTAATVTLYAQWKGNPYTVVYNANGGDETMADSSFNYGAAGTLRLNAFTRAGYFFDGWAKTAGGTREYTDGQSITITSAMENDTITLYARWIQGITVTFNADGGDPAPNNQTVAPGGKVDEPSAMTKTAPKTEYVFEGWYKEAGLTNKWDFATDTVTGPITLFAKWREKIIMVYVPGGSFLMGNPDSTSTNGRPQHTVTLTSFYIGMYEITQEQYQEVMGVNPSGHTTAKSRPPVVGEIETKRPVENVTWFDALEFCNKLSEREGRQPVYTITNRTPATGYPITSATVTPTWTRNGYRLPTESQWEYAARGGSGTPGNYVYAGSDNPDDVAWHPDNSGGVTHEVGMKAANGLGLYDMTGNVVEWCWDWYVTYPSASQTDPYGGTGTLSRVHRGGSFAHLVESSRSVIRNGSAPSSQFMNYGFRVVRPQ